MERIIFHVDVNSAYLSWESARRVQEGGADLRLVPAAVGGDRDKRTGVILAKSIPAKAYGVKTGEPVAMALQKCPALLLVRPDFRLYERCSRAFMDICLTYAPVLEKYSIDECFLDMTGTERMYPDPAAAAAQIKDAIRDTLGFTVNIGISSNKLLAKMASDFEKPDKVHTLYPWEVEAKLWPLPVRDLFTVGRATAEKLEQAHIKTIGGLARADLRRVQALVGKKLGQQLHDFANGIDASPVLAEPEGAKGYSISITTEDDIRAAGQAHKVLLSLADSVAGRMRADHAKAACISVTIRGNDFKNKSHQKKLPEPTDITDEIYAVSKALFTELWDQKTPLRLLGIALTDIQRAGYVQQSLFPDARKERARQLDKTVDAIRGRFGSDTILRGAAFQAGAQVGKKYKAQLESKRED